MILEAGETKEIENNGDIFGQTQDVKLKVVSGEYKDKIFEIQNGLSGNPSFDVFVKKGDKVIVGIEDYDEDSLEVYIIHYMRQNHIFYLNVLFIILLIIVERKKGIKSKITLSLTMIAILKILLSLVLKGINPLLITILVSIGITILTVFIVSSINSKSISIIIGTRCSALVAGIVAYIIGNKANLTFPNKNFLIFYKWEMNC